VKGDGTYLVSDDCNDAIRTVSRDYFVATLAGQKPKAGAENGTGSAARFSYPHSFATDRAGNVYVADAGNYVVRKITPQGSVTTFAGQVGVAGYKDGAGGDAQFDFLGGIVADKDDNLFVIDQGNAVIRKITPDGSVSRIAGLVGQPGVVDGTRDVAKLSEWMSGIAIDGSGNLYVAEGLDTTVRKVSPVGTVSTIASGKDGLADPYGIAVATDGTVYVSDLQRHVISSITTSGVVATLAGLANREGHVDAMGVDAQFNSPTGLAMTKTGNLLVASVGDHTVRKVTPTGIVSTVIGDPTQRGVRFGALPGIISAPEGLAVLPSGQVVVNADNAVLVTENATF
jgi:streptogramin lyase